MLLMMSIASGSATIRISDDHGGQIGGYLARYQAVRLSSERAVIDRICASACTMLLGIIPRNRICVTSRAILEFHAAWDPAPGGTSEVSGASNRLLWSSYPRDLQVHQPSRRIAAPNHLPARVRSVSNVSNLSLSRDDFVKSGGTQ